MNHENTAQALLASSVSDRNFIVTHSKDVPIDVALSENKMDTCDIDPNKILGHVLHSINESSKAYGKQATFIAGFIIVPLSEVLSSGMYEYQDTINTLADKIRAKFIPENIANQMDAMKNGTFEETDETREEMSEFLKTFVGEEAYENMKNTNRVKCPCPKCAQWRIDNGYRQIGEAVDKIVEELEQDLGKVQTREQYLLDSSTDELMRNDINKRIETADSVSKNILEMSLSDNSYKDLPSEIFPSLIERAALIKKMNEKESGILDEDVSHTVIVQRQNIRNDLSMLGDNLAAKNKEREVLEKALEIIHTEGINALKSYAQVVKHQVGEFEDDVQAKQQELSAHSQKYLIEKDKVTVK